MLLTLRVVSPRKNSAAPALLTSQPHCLHLSRMRQLPTELLQQPSVAFGRKGRPFQRHPVAFLPHLPRRWLDPDLENLNEFRPGPSRPGLCQHGKPRAASLGRDLEQQQGRRLLDKKAVTRASIELTCWAAQTQCLWNKGIRTEFWQILKSISVFHW